MTGKPGVLQSVGSQSRTQLSDRTNDCTGSSWRHTGFLWLWGAGSAALWRVGSSRSRDRTHVPCTGRQILTHCNTGEVPPAALSCF